MPIESAFFGSLVRDAEAKISKAGKQYVRLNIRIEAGEKALFVNVTVFDSEAIAIADQLVKGVRVYIEGRLTLDNWTGKDGAARQGLSVTAGHCRLAQIGRSRTKPEKAHLVTSDQGQSGHAPAGKAAAFNDDIPFTPEFR